MMILKAHPPLPPFLPFSTPTYLLLGDIFRKGKMEVTVSNALDTKD